MSPHRFSPIIPRNTPLPASRTEIYSTVFDAQDEAEMRVYQGENEDIRFNTLVGEFLVEGLAEVPAGNQILVRLDLDLSGILKVTATERATGLAKRVTIDNATERFRVRQRSDAVDRLQAAFESVEDQDVEEGDERRSRNLGPVPARPQCKAHPRVRRSDRLDDALAASRRRLRQQTRGQGREDHPRRQRSGRVGAAPCSRVFARQSNERSEEAIEGIRREIEDIVFYLEDK